MIIHYDRDTKRNAQLLRKNMTRQERHLWYPRKKQSQYIKQTLCPFFLPIRRKNSHSADVRSLRF